MIAMRHPRLAERMSLHLQKSYQDPITHFCMERYHRIDYFKKLDKRVLEEISFHLSVNICQFNQVIIQPGEISQAMYLVVKGQVQVFIQSGSEEVVIDYLGKGSVIGQYSVLANEKVMFGVRAIVPGGTSLLELTKETYHLLRMKKHEVD